MKITIEKVLSFYDGKSPDDSKHASSITGLVGEDIAAGLIEHYFDNNGGSCQILNEKPTEGNKKGKWLDRWLKVTNHASTTFYQTEIKNWCSHSIGGQRILLDADDETIIKYAHKRFSEQWNEDKETLRHHYVAKVLKPMRIVNSIDVKARIVEPLICFWYPILSTSITSITPFFHVDCKEHFDKLYFFSLSIYLRGLLKNGITTIDIDMHHFEQRIKKLQEMYDFGSTQHGALCNSG